MNIKKVYVISKTVENKTRKLFFVFGLISCSCVINSKYFESIDLLNPPNLVVKVELNYKDKS